MKTSGRSTSLLSIPSLLVPSAKVGGMGSDLVRLLLLMAFDLAIVAPIIPYRMLDLTSAWLAFMFITRSPLRSLLLLTIGALTLEQHGSYPAGTYLCSYVIAMTLISILRKQVAWRNYFPWLVAIVGVQCWVILLEFFLYFIKDASFFVYNLSFLLSQGVRLGMSLAIATIYYLSNSLAIGEEAAHGHIS